MICQSVYDKLLFDDGPVQGNNKKDNNKQGAY